MPGHQVSNTKPCSLALANTQSPYRLHVTNLYSPPPRIVLQGCFTWHTQNRATNAQFRVFGLNPTPRLCIGECAAPLASPCHPPAPTISCHRPTRPFYTARPKPSYKCSVLGFWPKPQPRLRVGKCAVPPVPPCHPLAPTISHYSPTLPSHTACPKPSYKHLVSSFWPKLYRRLRVGEHAIPPAPPCHPLAPTISHYRRTLPFHMACPKLSCECSVSGFWHKPCPLPSCWQTCSPPTTSMPSTCTNNLLSSPHTIISNGTPETESPLSVFGFFDPHSSHTRAASPPQPPCPQHSTTSPRCPATAICTDTEPLHSVFGFL